MGRARSRRRRGKTGGVGSSGSKSKSNKSKSKSTGGSRGRSSNTRGGQSKANKNQNKKARRTVKSVSKAIGKAFKGAAAHAGGHTKKPSKLRQQISNLRSNIQRQSTPEAKKQRRADRLRKQFGLDYSSMNPSFKVDVSVDQAARRLGIHQNPLYKRLPRDVRNWKFKYQTQAPTKRGIRDGYRAPDRGGQNIASATKDQLQSIRSETPGQYGGTNNWLDFYRPENQERLRKDYQEQERRSLPKPIRGQDQQGPGFGLFPMPTPRPIKGGLTPGRPRPIRGKPQPDTIAMMYENILGREADQGGLDYWKNELSSGRQTKDAIRQNILRSDEFQGRSEADREAAHRGVKRRKFQRERRRRGKPPRQRHGSGGHGGGLAGLGLGIATRNWKGKGRAKPTGKKPTGRGLFPSIAAAMAARGGF